MPTMAYDAYDNPDHVIWQSSQSACNALNQLMSEARKPLPTSSSHVNSGSPGCSPTIYSSPGALSPSFDFGPRDSSKRTRALRPRPTRSFMNSSPATTTPTSPLSSTPCGDPTMLLNLIEQVSKQVDHNSNLKRRVIERARTRAKERDRDRVRSEGRTKARLDGKIKKVSTKEKRFEMNGGRSCPFPGIASREERMELDGEAGSAASSWSTSDIARMPPPPVPPPPLFHAPRAEFNMNKIRFTTASVQDIQSSSKLRSAPTSPPSPMSPRKAPFRRELTIQTVAQPASQPSSQAPSVKGKAPALGMRRGTSNDFLTPSPSQKLRDSAGLPAKQRSFKTPFVKPAAACCSTAEAVAAVVNAKVTPPTPDATPSPPIPPRAVHSHPGPLLRRTPAAVGCGPPSTDRSSSPAPEADTSFGSVDWGVDEDELERICSAYD